MNLCKPAHLMIVCLGLSLAMVGCYGPDGADPAANPSGAVSGALSQRLVCRAGVRRAPGDAMDLCAAFPARCDTLREAAQVRALRGLLQVSSAVRALRSGRFSDAAARAAIHDAAAASFAAARVPPAAAARALSEMDAAAGRRSSAIGVRVVTLGAAMTAQAGPYLQALAQSGDGSGTAAYASESTVTTTLDSGWKISFGPFEIHENMTVTTTETVDEDDADYTEVCDEDGNCTCE